MRNRTKIIILLSVLFTLINTAVYIITEINKEQRIQIALDTHLNKLQTHYEILIHHQKVTADAAYKSTINIKKVIDILSKVKLSNNKQRDILRKQLFNILKNKYEILKTKGVLQYHFVLPDNKVFLRMHKPKKFGDDLSNIRYSFEYTNKTHKTISGFEKGKTTHAFRNLYPIYDENNNYLCAIEISFSSEFLQEYLINVSKIHTHFLINKHIFDTKAWDRDDITINYAQSTENKNYVMSVTHSDYKKEHITKNAKIIKPIKTQIYKKMAQEKKFSLFTIYNNEAIIISFYPIKNIKDNKAVAWIVSYDKDDFIEITQKMNLYAQIISFFILSILFYFIYRVINQKEILNIQVKEQTKNLAKTNKELNKNKQQLQLLNDNLEERVKDEVEKNQDKDRLLFQQSKMASMGEMIGNIAHQWRQPIAIISMWANNIIADIDMEEVEDKNLRKYAHKINEQTRHLSQTIDDFRNFFAPNKEKTTFKLKDSVDKTINLLTASFKTHNIEVIEDIKDIEITALENELTQSILNIIKNAKDIIVTLDNDTKKLIFINTYKKENLAVIEIIDNGGGVPKEIKDKIFEPYFTTKDKSQGTGIGLYMTQSIITKHLHGKIDVINVKYNHDNVDYIGG